jgi:hypothetical protein
VVVLFLTGEGQTTPAGVTGRVTTISSVPPLTPTSLAPISVLINGQAVPIAFSGELAFRRLPGRLCRQLRALEARLRKGLEEFCRLALGRSLAAV